MKIATAAVRDEVAKLIEPIAWRYVYVKSGWDTEGKDAGAVLAALEPSRDKANDVLDALGYTFQCPHGYIPGDDHYETGYCHDLPRTAFDEPSDEL